MNFSWKQEEKVVVNFPSGTQMLLTLGIMDSFGDGRKSAAERERIQYLKEKYGDDFATRLNDTDISTETFALLFRSVFFGSLKKVELRESENDEWFTGDLPDEWKAISCWCTDIHPEITKMLTDVALELNPNVLSVSESVTEKNAGRLSVKRLLH